MVTTTGKLKSEPFTVTVDENGEVVNKTPELQESSGWGESIRNQDADVIQRLQKGNPLGNAGPPATAELATIDRWLL